MICKNFFETQNAVYAGICLGNQSYILLSINQKAIDGIMLENNSLNGLGKTGESYLVGKDFLLRSKSRFIENSVRKTEARTKGVIDALEKLGTNEGDTVKIYDIEFEYIRQPFII